MPYKLSPSSLSLMKECPRCFWLTQHNIWKRPSSPFPSLPNGIDRILKIHFDKFREKGQLPPELCENGECIEMKLYDNPEQLKIWQDNFKGISWKDDQGNELQGAIDNLLIKDNKGIVLDYKTRGYALKENTHEYYQLQLDIYNFLLRKNNHATEDYAFLLFYIPSKITDTGEVVFDTTLKKVPIDVNNAEKIFNQAIKLLEGSCPSEKCEWCLGFKEE